MLACSGPWAALMPVSWFSSSCMRRRRVCCKTSRRYEATSTAGRALLLCAPAVFAHETLSFVSLRRSSTRRCRERDGCALAYMSRAVRHAGAVDQMRVGAVVHEPHAGQGRRQHERTSRRIRCAHGAAAAFRMGVGSGSELVRPQMGCRIPFPPLVRSPRRPHWQLRLDANLRPRLPDLPHR